MKASLSRLALAATRTEAFGGVLRAAERFRPPQPGSLSVLMYHRIGEVEDRPDLDPALLSATPAEFERQIGYVASTARAISLADLLAAQAAPESLRGAILVTFDDAYLDFAEQAWPILQRYSVPVALFVATAYPGDPTRAFWWDRLHHAVQTSKRLSVRALDGRALSLAGTKERQVATTVLGAQLAEIAHDRALELLAELVAELGGARPGPAVLGWDRLRRLAAEGVTLGPHSQTHPLLHRIPVEAARAELVGSLEDLERELGARSSAFAYPAGGHTEPVVNAAREAGISVAFTTRRGRNRLAKADWLRLRRINVGRRTNVALLRAQLLFGRQ